MVSNENNNPANGVEKITPAKVNLTGHADSEPQSRQWKNTAKNMAITFMFFVLILCSVLVIFVLPYFIETDKEPEVAETTTETATPAPAVKKPPTPAASPQDSPFRKAQLSELRKETQEILSEILEAQKSLTEKNVTVWAEQDYQKAIQHAETGDQHYAEQSFAAAKDEYVQARDILNELLDRVDIIFEEKIVAGTEALKNGDSATALAAFDVALAIDAIDRAALAGRERALKLDDVIALVNKGDLAVDNDELEDARTHYQEALDLDGETVSAKEKLARVNEMINERNFNEIMSTGFNHLQNNQLEQARKSFSAALKIYPDSKDARTALSQVNHNITSRNINSYLAQAEQQEQAEQWDAAMGSYNKAIKLDSNLVSAQQGLKRAQTWANIHKKMDQILAQPERLFDLAVLNETSAFLASVQKVSDPGPQFKQKMAKLNAAIARADNPVLVRLQSDNLTRVTLYKYKNGNLGTFTTKELVLRPGKYVAKGEREGYRDVRVEFFIDPDKPMQPVVIVTREKIALGK